MRQRQPILTAGKVIALLEKHVTMTEDERATFKQLADESKLVGATLKDPGNQIPVLKRCAEFLQEKGYFVYLDFCADSSSNFFRCDFIVGKCGWLYDKLTEQAARLENLLSFIERHKDRLPYHIRQREKPAKKLLEKIRHLLDCLLYSYEHSEQGLGSLCRKGENLFVKAHTFISASLVDLRDLYERRNTVTRWG